MLLSEDDITVITLGPCFSVFVYICADWWKSDNSVDGEPQGIWWWSIKFQRCSCMLSFLFLSCRQSALESLLAGETYSSSTLLACLLLARVSSVSRKKKRREKQKGETVLLLTPAPLS